MKVLNETLHVVGLFHRRVLFQCLTSVLLRAILLNVNLAGVLLINVGDTGVGNVQVIVFLAVVGLTENLFLIL